LAKPHTSGAPAGQTLSKIDEQIRFVSNCPRVGFGLIRQQNVHSEQRPHHRYLSQRRREVDALPLDNTGTTILGNRRATEFIPVSGVSGLELEAAAKVTSIPTRLGRAVRSSCW
jgi:hypothetical protein